MDQIELCNHLFFYDIVYKKNLKNIHYVNKDGIILISAPYSMSNKRILKILKDNENRIYKFMNKVVSTSIKLEDGMTLRILEKHYTIVKYSKSFIDDNYIYLKDISVKELYKVVGKLLLEYLKERQKYYFNQMYLLKKEPNILIKNVKTYYGQYNRKYHHVTYNIGLVFVSKRCIDYIIVHELSHIKEMHHSTAFYNQMIKYNPDYKEDKKLLKKEWIKLC